MGNKKEYSEWLQSRGLQPRTIAQYSKALENMSEICDAFDQINVSKFTAKYKGNVMRSFVRSYKNFLLRNPEDSKLSLEKQNKIRFIDVPVIKQRKRKTPMTISEDQMFTMYKHMPDEETQVLLMVSFFCGLRRAELLSLTPKMFNFKYWVDNPEDMGMLTIIGKGNKLGNIPVKSTVMRLVYEYLPENYKEDVLIFEEMKPRRWNRILSKVGKEALGVHVKPHTLRHSMAMHLRGSGFAIDEIKEFLRHEDISTTQIYSRVTPEQLREKFKRI